MPTVHQQVKLVRLWGLDVTDIGSRFNGNTPKSWSKCVDEVLEQEIEGLEVIYLGKHRTHGYPTRKRYLVPCPKCNTTRPLQSYDAKSALKHGKLCRGCCAKALGESVKNERKELMK